jgi:hypothetical protein
MDSGLLTGFMSPIRPKEIVSPSVKSDELFLSWLCDRKTKEFIVQLASQVDGEVPVAPQSSTSKKQPHTPKKSERNLLQMVPMVAAPLYSLSSNRYPMSFIRRHSHSHDSAAATVAVDQTDSATLLSPRSAGVSASKPSKKSPRSKEHTKESSKDAQSEVSSDTGAVGPKSSPAVVTPLQLGQIAITAASVPSPTLVTELESLFSHYYSLPPATGLDSLVDDLLLHFGLPRSLFFPLKYKLHLSSSPMGYLNHQHIALKEFMEKVWTPELVNGDTTSRVFNLIKEDPKRNYLVPTDWIVFTLGLLEEHPGLELIKGETEYQERYIDAVVTRLHFAAARRSRTRITLREFRNAQILASIEQLDQLQDITRYPRYFDYMSYFVIYSKFTELDQDKDWMISKEELATYNHHALTTRIIDRAFHLSRFLPRPPNNSSSSRRNSHQYQNSDLIGASHSSSSGALGSNPSSRHISSQGRSSSSGFGASGGAPQASSSSNIANAGRSASRERPTRISPRNRTQEPFAPSGVPYSFVPNNRFGFMDFAWFILAEEDKTAPTSIDLWFNCLDRDEDGYLSPQDIYSFYEEQMVRLEFSVLDIVPFDDAMAQIIDIVGPTDPARISLIELRKSGFAREIFDMLFNGQKFVLRDRAIAREGSLGMDTPASSWESFASTEYLIAFGETPYGDEGDEWDDENLDIWVEVATETPDSETASSTLTNSTAITPRDLTI